MLKTRHRERILLAACLEAKQPFVLDNTNLTREARSATIAQAKAAEFSIVGYYFQSALQDAIARNALRTGKAQIPVKGLLAAHRKLEVPSLDEGLDALWYVRINTDGQFVVEEWNDEIR
jgi:predicted kinase